MSAPRIVVIGSANMDLIVQAERIAAPGETVLGGAFATAPGGKGANQAVAAARLGGDVTFVTRLGTDSFGDALARELVDAGVRPDFLIRDAEAPNGVALISVDAKGQNAIMVAPGANARLSPADVQSAKDAIAAANWIVLQLEIPMETVSAAISLARSLDTLILLNPAPFQLLPSSLLEHIDLLTPNEHEAAQMLGEPFYNNTNGERCAEALRKRGVSTVIVTMGSEGCILSDEMGTRRLPALRVSPVDTTAAGDCFTGALAVGLGEGRTLDEAAVFASRAAAISVTRMGALPSLPTRAEVENFAPQV